jgi:hypothetical protein
MGEQLKEFGEKIKATHPAVWIIMIILVILAIVSSVVAYRVGASRARKAIQPY